MVIQNYLPKALSEEEIAIMVEKAVADSNAESMKDMGKVMGILKPQMLGRADMSVVSSAIKTRLSS